MKELLNELKVVSEEMNILEKEFETDFENKELELKCDKAYEKYYGIAQKIAHKIVVITDGSIPFPIARQMVYQKPEELQRILG